MSDACEKCGHEFQIGDFPFCNGPGSHMRAVAAVHQDTVEGGFWAENGFKYPRYFESRKAHRDALAAEGKEIAAKWVPGDKHLTRWDSVDLEGAAALTMRGMQARAEKRAIEEEFTITVTDVTFTQEA